MKNQELHKLVAQTKANFDQLLRATDKAFANIGGMDAELTAKSRKALTDIKAAVENRDVEKLQQLTQEYANHDSK
jgi:uncharacterized lipoprotein YehR (DUF1307 family)